MVAVDVMGGDFAPEASMKGALNAARQNIPVMLCGPIDEMESYLNTLDSAWKSYPIKLLNANETIEMGENPVKAALKKPDSSLVKAVKSVKSGDANSVISAGNSGALMAAATFVLGREDNIERPAIMGFLPGKKGRTLCLDLGANTDCKPAYFVQFARLAIRHLEKLGKKDPSVGLLSNGSEPSKGSTIIKEAHQLLKESTLNFIGNVEPGDVLNNKTDIVVCDGLSGNILLKTMESMSGLVSELLMNKYGDREMIQHLLEELSMANPGGAQLLGVKGTVIVAHGCANQFAIENAIKTAWRVSISR